MTRNEDDEEGDDDLSLMPENLQPILVAVTSLESAKDLASTTGPALTPRTRLALLSRARTLARAAVADLTLAMAQARFEMGDKK